MMCSSGHWLGGLGEGAVMRAVSKHAFPGATRTCRHLFVCRKLSWEQRGRLFPSAARWGGVAGREGGAVLVFKVDYFVFLVVFDY
jgi:hypothetical protein